MPRDYILYHPKTSVTGKHLKNVLGIDGGTRPPTDRVRNLIRWGNSEKVRYKPRWYWNSRNAVLNATNKFKSLVELERNYIPVPEHSTDFDDLKFPMLARQYNHQAGTDIKLCMQRRDCRDAIREGADYFVEYVPTKYEYRVHVFDNEAIKVSQKLRRRESGGKAWIRNTENGYVYCNVRNGLSSDQIEDCVSAVSVLGLDFGAVDLIVADDGEHYVLEVNTAPSLMPTHLEMYAESMAEILGTNVDRSYISRLRTEQDSSGSTLGGR